MNTKKIKQNPDSQIRNLKQTLVSKPSYLRWSSKRVANRFKTTVYVANNAKTLAKAFLKNAGLEY